MPTERTDAVSRRGFWRYRRVALPLVRGPAQISGSAAEA
jgi:hypothetical protein